jgi:hypothetical protein
VSILGFMNERPLVLGVNYQAALPTVEIPPQERPLAEETAAPDSEKDGVAAQEPVSHPAATGNQLHTSAASH